MAEPEITYAPRADATPEAEISALANAYRFILGCRAKEKAVPDRRPEDARERIKDARTRTYST